MSWGPPRLEHAKRVEGPGSPGTVRRVSGRDGSRPGRAPWSRRRRTALTAAVVGALLVLGGVVLVPDEPPGLRHTSVLNVLFDSRAVVGGTRLLALALAVYLLVSVVVRVERDQWLRNVGPADVAGREIEDVADDRVALQELLAEAEETIQELRQQLGEADSAYRALARDAGVGEDGGSALTRDCAERRADGVCRAGRRGRRRT